MIPSVGQEVIDGSIPSPGRSLESSTSKVRHGAALFGIFSFTLVCMSLFEAVGRALDPAFGTYGHAATIVFSTLVATLAGAFVLRRVARHERRVEEKIRTLGVDERRHVEDALQVSEQDRRQISAQADIILEAVVDGIVLIDGKGIIQSVNPATERIFGYAAEELVGRNVNILMPAPFHDEHDTYLSNYLDTGRRKIIGMGREVVGRRKGGATFPLDLAVAEVPGPVGRSFVGMIRDISESEKIKERLRQSEEQFRQAQKMEAVGRLAGGVAHDFNTVLGTILGYSEMLLEKIPEEDSQRRAVDQIHRCAGRGASLTRQLLTFSRQQALKPKVIHLNQVIAEMDDMLQRLSGDDVEVVQTSATELDRVKVDPCQVEQIIMNLVVNACDAMPRGGRITIGTCHVDLDESALPSGGSLEPGHHVLLEVTDTGNGMDEETSRRLFEPFFTTKEAGKGTGLGLSMVYGIVRQSGGHVSVESELGRGTSIKILLPRVEAAVEATEPEPVEREAVVAADGTQTVLVVEDDEMFRGLLCEVLEAKGYTVISAAEPAAALAGSEEHVGTIDLLVSDMVMPGGLTGKELADRLAARYPLVKIILMSGYTDQDLAQRGGTGGDAPFLQKPFSTRDFLGTVCEVLSAERC